MVDEAPTELNLEKIIKDTINMEGANVKAVIGPRGDRVSRIREITGVKKVELNPDQKTFTVTGTVPQIEAAKNLMTEIVSGRLEGVAETSAVTQFLTSRSRDIIGPKGRMVNKIQETTRTYTEVCETSVAGVSQAKITATAEAVNADIAGIQLVATTGQYKPSARTIKHDTSWIAEPPGIGDPAGRVIVRHTYTAIKLKYCPH